MASCNEAVASLDGPTSDQKSAASGAASRGRVFRTVNPADCLDLLEGGGIGRVGFAAEDEVMMLPVNFAVSRGAIMFRTAPDTLLALYADTHLSFEVDHFDETLGEGWSVLVQGHAHRVTDEREVKHLEEAICLEPWAPGARDVYVRIVPTRISGRSIRSS